MSIYKGRESFVNLDMCAHMVVVKFFCNFFGWVQCFLKGFLELSFTITCIKFYCALLESCGRVIWQQELHCVHMHECSRFRVHVLLKEQVEWTSPRNICVLVFSVYYFLLHKPYLYLFIQSCTELLLNSYQTDVYFICYELKMNCKDISFSDGNIFMFIIHAPTKTSKFVQLCVIWQSLCKF